MYVCMYVGTSVRRSGGSWAGGGAEFVFVALCREMGCDFWFWFRIYVLCLCVAFIFMFDGDKG